VIYTTPPLWFVYDTYKTMKATRMRHGWVHMFITHRPTLTLQLHNFDLFRICCTSSFCTVAWQLARFQLTRRIARSLGDSWASCSRNWWLWNISHWCYNLPVALEQFCECRPLIFFLCVTDGIVHNTTVLNVGYHLPCKLETNHPLVMFIW